jgi:hypothetical protein
MKDKVKLSSTKTEITPPSNAIFLFIFESRPIYGQTQGFSVVFLTL